MVFSQRIWYIIIAINIFYVSEFFSDASFSEYFYSLQRVLVGDNGQGSSQLGLKKRVFSLFCLVSLLVKV